MNKNSMELNIAGVPIRCLRFKGSKTGSKIVVQGTEYDIPLPVGMARALVLSLNDVKQIHVVLTNMVEDRL